FYFGADNHEFAAGARYLHANAERSAYGYQGYEAMASFLFKLPRGFELSTFAYWTEEDYKGPATVLERDRRSDERLRAGVGLNYRIDDAWTVESVWQYTRNHSNSALYRYEQHYVNLGLVWNF
ncbi:MAG: surface lipoprotein assembly modifier, partial [Candidatus Accumulibacter sp.]|nr:surface lipoprotein assembly modifier [Accumulibacter sp.]